MHKLLCYRYLNERSDDTTPEEIRKRLNLTQTEFANSIGMTRRGYQDRLYNNPNWRLSELIEIAKLNENQVKVIYNEKEYIIKIEDVK